MPSLGLLPLAVHLPDGPILTEGWLIGGFAAAILLAFVGAWRIRDEEIPLVALLTAGFFVASLIHVRVGPTSVHLLLTGLMGVVLGRRAALAIPVGLFLQAALLQHGGFTTLGINTCVMALPALLAWQMFAVIERSGLIRRPGFRAGLVAASTLVWVVCLIYGLPLVSDTMDQLSPQFHLLSLGGAAVLALLVSWVESRLENSPEFPLGLLVGEAAVVGTVFLNCFVLLLGGKSDWRSLVKLTLVPHLVIAVVEGIVLGFTVGFLAKVKPEMLRWTTLPEETKCPVDAIS